jgi:Zn-dependent metalloprotease
VLKDVDPRRDGTEHVRFDRTYLGLPMIGGDVVVHQKDGKFRSASLTLGSSQRPSLTPRIKADAAHGRGGREVRRPDRRDLQQGPGDVRAGTPARAAPTRSACAACRRPRAKPTCATSSAPAPAPCSTAGTPSRQPAAVGTGKTLLVGNVSLNTSTGTGGYQLVDSTRGGGNTRNGLGKVIDNVYNSAAIMTDADNIWGNNTTSDVASEASDAHYGVQQTWDFYKNTFGRSGIYNDGVGVKSIVHVTFRNQGPATGGKRAWYGAPYKFMAYGLGTTSWYPVVAIDVAGHEMTHGVTEATAGLTYSNDAGGLNEASSDIMGTMVEWYTNNSADTPDYMIGEKIYKSNPNGTTALRYMFLPGAADGNRSYNCYPAGGLTGVDPHYSSGPGNHFFYLLAEGAVSPPSSATRRRSWCATATRRWRASAATRRCASTTVR